MFLEQIPEDIDIATNATPKDLEKLFPKIDLTSAKFGSVLISKKGQVFEVTTFRKDSPISNGRHPDSIEYTNKESDAARRDITINAMYWNPISSELFDPFNGQRDLHEKLVRIIGNPIERIQHDALRLLRVIRFRSQIKGQYHPETFDSLHKCAGDAVKLSGTRVFSELEKILMTDNPQIAFEDMWETDIIESILPELHACKGVAQPSHAHAEGDVWNHTLAVIGSFTDDHGIDTRLGALFHDIGKPPTFEIRDDRIHFDGHASLGAEITKGVLDRLQCTANRRDKICWLVSHHMMIRTFLEDLSVERKSHWYYHPWFIELLQVLWLDCAGSTPTSFHLYDEIIEDYNQFLDEHPLPPKPLIGGDEVMEILGIQPGEEVGKVLEKVYEAQINGEIKTKSDAEKYISSI